MIISEQHEPYFRDVARSERQLLAFDPWEEAPPRDCHGNVKRWLESHPEDAACYGWVIMGPMFIAHSVVRTADGKLIDITPTDSGTTDVWFVEHTGSVEEFWALQSRYQQAWFNPFSENSV